MDKLRDPGGHDDDLRSGPPPLDPSRRFEAVEPRHHEIGHDQVWLLATYEFERRQAILRLEDRPHMRIGLAQQLRAGFRGRGRATG